MGYVETNYIHCQHILLQYALLTNIMFPPAMEDGETPTHFKESMANSKTTISGHGIRHKSSWRMHGLKRATAQHLQENVHPQIMVRRCGWPARGLHTLFDYCFNSPEQDVVSGLAISGWHTKLSGKVQGGVAPDLTNVRTAKSKVDVFLRALFRQ